MTAVDMLRAAKCASAVTNALPSEFAETLARHQKQFNRVKGVKPMKFKGETVTGKNKTPGTNLLTSKQTA